MLNLLLHDDKLIKNITPVFTTTWVSFVAQLKWISGRAMEYLLQDGIGWPCDRRGVGGGEGGREGGGGGGGGEGGGGGGRGGRGGGEGGLHCISLCVKWFLSLTWL